jgi:hypothetical protein
MKGTWKVKIVRCIRELGQNKSKNGEFVLAYYTGEGPRGRVWIWTRIWTPKNACMIQVTYSGVFLRVASCAVRRAVSSSLAARRVRSSRVLASP